MACAAQRLEALRTARCLIARFSMMASMMRSPLARPRQVVLEVADGDAASSKRGEKNAAGLALRAASRPACGGVVARAVALAGRPGRCRAAAPDAGVGEMRGDGGAHHARTQDGHLATSTGIRFHGYTVAKSWTWEAR